MTDIGYRFCTVGKPIRQQKSRYTEKSYTPVVHFKGINYLLHASKKRAAEAVAYALRFAERWNKAEDWRLFMLMQESTNTDAQT